MHLAIFGGSFDPVHIAHVKIVDEALKQLEIDKLIVVPTYLNPFKTNYHLEPKTRYELLKKIFQKNEKIEISDFEIDQNEAVPSIKTVNHLKNLYKPSKIYLIIGADNLKSLEKWYKFDELNSLVEFVVATRDGYKNDKLDSYKVLNVNIDISSSKLREEFDLNFIPYQIKDDIIHHIKT
ncbi:nicotinate (nicotinamide) nucleotide adenylyltransferase [Arcobacter sp. YIC-464]|uniref:nicotinate (nicotinamide) nucleotide adenylyltransferase n=1 Tax=Arcobacter sp. YIC-464 TaxID=3376631 RepID=UPI003C180E41